MRMIPDSAGLREDNDCHNPAGSPAGGEFCSNSPFAAAFKAAGYRVGEGRPVTLTATGGRPGAVRVAPEVLRQLKAAIAETPVVNGWRFTYNAPEYRRSVGGKTASKSGVRVDPSKRAKHTTATITMRKEG